MKKPTQQNAVACNGSPATNGRLLAPPMRTRQHALHSCRKPAIDENPRMRVRLQQSVSLNHGISAMVVSLRQPRFPACSGRRDFLLACGAVALLPELSTGQDSTAKPDETITLTPIIRPNITTRIRYAMRLEGKLATPSASGTSEFQLNAQGNFDFEQRQFPSGDDGSFTLRAARRYNVAQTATTVGKDPERKSALPSQSNLVYLYGKDSQLLQYSPEIRLTRPQVDLLQFACDPLAVTGLFPSRQLTNSGETWNADTWVLAMLTGVDAFITQTVICKLEKLTPTEALIAFDCQGQGAVSGAATDITLKGTLTCQRTDGMVRNLSAVMKEKRSASSVSAGLNVTASIEWSQEVAQPVTKLPEAVPSQFPEQRLLLLTLVTPWRLLLLHNRDWHVFHETADLVILRMLHNGSLIAQCNLAPAAQLSPGKFTAEDEFLADVERKITARQGQITRSTVESDVGGWRIHHVQATTLVETSQQQPATADTQTPKAQTVVWDYYLCSARSGEQYSLLFSHAEEDAMLFNGVPDQFLKTMTIRSARPKTVLPR